MFGTIWVNSGPFGCLTKLGAKRAELVQEFVPRSRVGIFRNERTRSSPFDPKLTFWCISYYLGALRTVWLPYKSRCKTAEVVRAMKSCQNFSQRMYPSTPLNPKLMFHSFLYYFVHLAPFGFVTKLNAKRAKLMQKFVPRSRVRIFRNERTRSTPLDP